MPLASRTLRTIGDGLITVGLTPAGSQSPVPAKIIAGHGASDLVSAGNSGANRRVTVVIEGPS